MQTNIKKPYVKTIDDELDWKTLDQLHNATLQISGFCYEYKKFCITTEFVVLTFLVNFTKNNLAHVLFIAGLIIPVVFWILDAVAYFYQKKLRDMMNKVRSDIKTRHQKPKNNTQHEGEKIAKSSWFSRLIAKSSWLSSSMKAFSLVINATINHSMWIYAFLVIADLFVWELFIHGYIK
ncbi:MAG: hypothetical protein PHU06_13400 [Gallionella sp.]|nr:hypothetical protein [Gallionella sp.]MDD4959786.1 hypothetical protein [Gallionella sp.]